ncbi:unnamed protein product [Porites evermanni]|uniref:RRM domain-containing protein n=1 Tax=Porites evermanni TaxID=104178 RepID=A0ABN8LW48_9CNID|nr:unnamed protein product [Porites evermanni]
MEFNPEEGFSVITFMSAESARGVLNKENLTLDNAELTVTLRKPTKKLPVDTKTLFVKGLSEKTTRDGLETFMEVASGLEVLDVQFGEQGGALVVFKETYSYDTITQKVAKKPLDGNMLAVEQVPVCHCVQVTGLNTAKTTEDALRYYFEKHKSGGGDVSSVELNIKDGWALVYFENPDGM